MVTEATEVDGGYKLSGSKVRRLAVIRADAADLDQQLADRGHLRGLGQVQVGRQDPRLHSREGHEGLDGASDQEQAVAARVDHRLDLCVARQTNLADPAVMDEVPVPRDNMLPGVEGLKGPFSCLKSVARRAVDTDLPATPATASRGACSARSRTVSRRRERTRSTAINSACRSRASARASRRADRAARSSSSRRSWQTLTLPRRSACSASSSSVG